MAERWIGTLHSAVWGTNRILSYKRGRRGRDIIPVQSVPITTNVEPLRNTYIWLSTVIKIYFVSNVHQNCSDSVDLFFCYFIIISRKWIDSRIDTIPVVLFRENFSRYTLVALNLMVYRIFSVSMFKLRMFLNPPLTSSPTPWSHLQVQEKNNVYLTIAFWSLSPLFGLI
jgi:hypothetical protein